MFPSRYLSRANPTRTAAALHLTLTRVPCSVAVPGDDRDHQQPVARTPPLHLSRKVEKISRAKTSQRRSSSSRRAESTDNSGRQSNPRTRLRSKKPTPALSSAGKRRAAGRPIPRTSSLRLPRAVARIQCQVFICNSRIVVFVMSAQCAKWTPEATCKVCAVRNLTTSRVILFEGLDRWLAKYPVEIP